MTSYHGGKQRIGKELANIIFEESTLIEQEENFVIRGYCEPFCGMLGVYRYIPVLFQDHKPKLKYKAGDQNKSVIMMWQKAQKGWKPSTKLTSEEKFKRMKRDGRSSAEKGFVGHLYGYMGKYFQPFDSRITKERLIKNSNKISDIALDLDMVDFKHGNYKNFSTLKNYIIYCDPPYQVSADYYSETGQRTHFDHQQFWDWCRKMAKNNIVFISEYNAPKDFEKIASIKTKTAGNPKIDNLYII